MKNKTQVLGLLDQIIRQAKDNDNLHKAKMLKEGKGHKAIGDSWLVFHLNILRDIIDENKI